MPLLFWDIETRSTVSLEAAGAWRYAADPTTEVLCVGYAVDDAYPQIWIADQSIPSVFVEAARDPNWTIVAHNFAFERAIATRILETRYNWPRIPLAQQRCTMALALANALPGELEGAVGALGLPFQKDRDGYRLMRQMSRPRRAGKNEDPDRVHWHDSPELRERLHRYCARDVEAERALFHHLPPLPLTEQKLWELDAIINERGFHVDCELARAARDIASRERIAINAEISTLTEGAITSADQVAKITTFVRRNGHALNGLTKRSVNVVLAHNPGDDVQRLLELRREGARASTRKLSRLLASVDNDDRLRGTLRFHAASTGRWSGRQFQPQNLKKPEIQDLDSAIDAVLTGDVDRVRTLGAPLTITGDIARSIICAAPKHVLIGGDFSAIESRVLAWLAEETWKLETYREFDRTNDPKLEPYCVTASRIRRRLVTPEDEAGRALGKVADLAFGYGGGRGAWRKFDSSESYSDTEIEHFKREWRRQHAATVRLWRALERAAHLASRTGRSVILGNDVSFTKENGTLFMTLPSGRRLAYPEAQLVAGKFEGTREIQFKDNAKGGWTDRGIWYGTLVENLVQATARDLLAAAMLRLEANGYPIVLHVHDEILCEMPEGFGSKQQFYELMTTLPDWAAGLPIAAKVRSGKRYAKSSETRTTTPEDTQPSVGFSAEPEVPSKSEKRISDRLCASVSEHNLSEQETTVSLADLIDEPLTDRKMCCCPFHDDSTPSLQIYDDHFHCFGCGAHGDAIDWLMMVEGLTRKEAIARIEEGPQSIARPCNDEDDKRRCALRLWDEAKPIAGTLAARYLAEARGIDLEVLPANVDEVLRFHPRCPFGRGIRHPCLLALLRNVTTDAPTGIHRIALTSDADKIARRMLGRWGAVKLWPPDRS